jgi:CHAT domain-containing protein
MSGDIMKAITLEQDANNVRENYLKSGLSNGSEHHKREYINSFDQDIQIAISLHLAAGPSNLPAARLALMTLLQRKGRILDILTQDVTYMRQTLDRGRRHPNSSSKELLDQLQKANVLLNQLLEVNRRRASLFVKAHRAKLAAEQFETHEAARILAGEAQDLEVKIAQILSVAYRPFQQPITLERMQQSIPAGSALVEFSVYKPFDYKAKPPQKTWGEARYIAYILSAHGPPVSVDLGPTDLIDRMVNDFREGLSKPENVYVPRIARKLDEQIMRPVRKLLGETQHIFLSPDGALNLVPFGAFVDENDQYLIKRYAFTYLSSGRDLLRIPTKSESRQPGTIIADVDFGSTEKITQRRQTEKISPNQRSTQLVAEEFQPLPGTAEEAREISKLFPEANVLTGKQATESALKQLNGPQILHLATHGFFFPALSEDPMEDQGFQLQNDSLVPQGPKTENPLWRSGLALANANQLKSGAEDGMLTALEAAGLNLWGTKLVVLSACETGVGEIHNGEGIFGLRRALVIAGSESQVMSLWIVKDQATKVLMIDYYKHLISKMGRSEALRQAQLEMLNSEEYKHPYYWASFVPSGDWKPLKIDLSAEPIVVTEH